MRVRTGLLLAVLGAIVLGVTAWDGAGSVAKDRTPPTAPKILGPHKTESPFPIFTFISTDAVTPRARLRYRCAFDTTLLHACAARYSQKLSSGRHVLRAQAVDRAGNRSRVTSFAVLVVTPPPPPVDESPEAQLAKARAATERFQDPAVAIAAGYVPRPECVDGPGNTGLGPPGAMGIHYEHPALMADGVIDVQRPEMLNYEPTASGHRLVAVEYWKPDADQDAGTTGDAPKLFGVTFEGPMPGHYDGMPMHYDLHVWLYKPNPRGIFNAFNPDARCPASQLRRMVYR